MSGLNSKRKAFFNNPARAIVTSFALLITAGALVLALPICSRSGSFTSLLTTFFTATSASCVTGLVVVDTYTYWTPFGQSIILCLIQLGGLGIVTFTTFFNIALRKRLALHSMNLATQSVSSDDMFDTRRLITSILAITFTCEGIGAVVLAFSFVPAFGLNGVFYSLFIGISAFCNAGFDTFGFMGQYTSLVPFASQPAVLIPVASLIILGGLGFIVWYDLIMFRRSHRIILHTKVVLAATAALLAIGTLFFLLFEWNNPNTMGNMNFWDKLLNSFFQSTTARTAGFNSIDNGKMTIASKMLSIFLMFIGASPGSTGGGIKTSTFVVIIMTVVSVLRNRNETVIFKRRIDHTTVYKAITVTIASLFAVIVVSMIVYFTNAHGDDYVLGIDALFETVSGFATVGLSTGVTAVANDVSRIALILIMFLGRVGPISLALSLSISSANKVKNQVIPEGKIAVG